MKLPLLALLALVAGEPNAESASDWRYVPHELFRLAIDWNSIEGPQDRRSANFALWGLPPQEHYQIVQFDIDCTARTMSHVISFSHDLSGTHVGTSIPIPNVMKLNDEVGVTNMYNALCLGMEPSSERFQSAPDFVAWAKTAEF